MQKSARNHFFNKLGRLCCAFFAFLFGLSVCSCSLFYDYDKEGRFGIGYSKIENSAFIADVDYDFGDDRKIILPSDYNGIKIKTLGGYFGRGVPSPFGLSVKAEHFFPDADRYYTTSESNLYDQNSGWWDKTEIVNCPIEIVLPQYLEKIDYLTLDVISVGEFETKSGKTLAKIFRPTFSFSISETNKYFFTRGGKIYNKNDGSLIGGIVYTENFAL